MRRSVPTAIRKQVNGSTRIVLLETYDVKQRVETSAKEAKARKALRRRVLQWYSQFNSENWANCFAIVDPRLTSTGKVNEVNYASSLGDFKKRYGAVHPWHVRLSVHVTGLRPASDPRPFAYVYTVWQDDRHEFHMFRERWVRAGDKWYTRVTGLVVNDARLG